jgi:hypothetical protein
MDLEEAWNRQENRNIAISHWEFGHREVARHDLWQVKYSSSRGNREAKWIASALTLPGPQRTGCLARRKGIRLVRPECLEQQGIIEIGGASCETVLDQLMSRMRTG